LPEHFAGMPTADYHAASADLAAGGELVVNEVHRPGLVDPTCIGSILAQLGFHAALRRFVTQLVSLRRLPPAKLSITHISGHAEFKTDLDIC
jgi:hypothetical protein